MTPLNPAKTSVPIIPSPWASAWGEDAYGYWQAFEVKGIRQVMRWIPAGEFIQGSPEGELERSEGEVQRQVTLTQGFWLADTACTQALWQAVMGDKPSRFKGDQLPVEQVSWKDCQAFLNVLKALLPEFDAQFPTEAQWEYACRAGTSTPFNWGSAELNSKLANFNGAIPYADNPESEHRETTVDVYGSSCGFHPNNWGLYQMHGNVLEWCAEPAHDPIHDPTGPSEGTGRIVRGGSWFFGGNWLRSAYRGSSEPGLRGGSLGLRVAAGETHQPAG